MASKMAIRVYCDARINVSLIVLIIVKILVLFKCFLIFFRQSVVKLQIILYFCTLEIIPLLLLWVAMVYTANSLKINF